jgi:hypothetical protein
VPNDGEMLLDDSTDHRRPLKVLVEDPPGVGVEMSYACRAIAGVAFVGSALAACAHTATVGGVCAPAPNAAVCVGSMTVPPGDEARFQDGAKKAIDAVLSPDFESKLSAFMLAHSTAPAIEASWRGWDAPRIALEERNHFTNQIGVHTYDGPGALYYRIFKHNIAFEGVPDDAGNRSVPINRFALKGRTATDIANTLSHEVAHAVGLTHPDSDTNLPRAFCEPPYVIGTIVEQIVEGADWKWSSSGDCKCFEPGADQATCVP